MVKKTAQDPDAQALRRRAEEQVPPKKAAAQPPRTKEDMQRLVHELEVHQIELVMQNAELRQARDELEKALVNYTDLYDFAPVGYFTLDRKGVVNAVNLTGATILGVERGRLINRRFGQFVDASDRPVFTAFLDRLFTSQCKETCEVTLTTEEHPLTFVHIEALPCGAGKECRVAVIDITVRKEAEKALHRKDERLALALDAARLAVWDWHIPSGDAHWNEMLYLMMGYEPGEVQSSYQAWASRVHPDDIGAVESRLRQSMAERSVYIDEYRTRWPDGTIRWLEVRGNFEYDANNQPLSSYGVMLDITERKQSEEAIRNSERLYRAIGESIDYGIWICAPDGRNIYASESFLRLVGMTQEQCSDFGWGDVLHPDDSERTILAWQECVRTGGVWDREHRFRGVDGHWHPILARGVPVRDDCGEVICWAGINLDIGRLKQAEEDLLISNNELTRFNSTMVGRELRMIELKKEINELSVQSGLPPRYPLDFEKEYEKGT